jgi:rhodanese-related sulfurtransferase
MRQISRAELKKKIDTDSPKLVFTLGEWQYRAAHIPGSLLLPCTSLLYRSEDALNGLQQDDDIVVYCSNPTCSASISTYYLLKKRGFTNVSHYAGGLLDWQEANYPLEGDMSTVH